MITITILQNQQQYAGLECSGHAGFANAGKDIVCASVSMLVINTINGIEQFTEDGITLEAKEPSVTRKGFKKVYDDDSYIKLYFTGDVSSESKLLMDVLVLGLKEISKQYGDSYLTLKFREV